MIRAGSTWAVAARTPAGTIEVTRRDTPRWTRWARGVPLVRGTVALLTTVVLGMRAMEWSRQATEEAPERRRSPALAAAVSILTVAAVLVLVGAGPGLLAGAVGGGPVVVAVVEAVSRLALVVGYIVGVTHLPGIAEVLRYHGAEHMAIAAYEAGAPLEVGSVRRFSPRHPRCGTDFLVLVALASAVVYGLVSSRSLVVLVASRVLLFPIVAGLAFEVLRLAGRPAAAHVHKPLVALGLALQRLTTRPPADEHVEVALAALRAAVAQPAADITA
jgi:uncharacterized protein YqhQ